MFYCGWGGGRKAFPLPCLVLEPAHGGGYGSRSPPDSFLSSFLDWTGTPLSTVFSSVASVPTTVHRLGVLRHINILLVINKT